MNLKHFICAYNFDKIESNKSAINRIQADSPSKLIALYAHQAISVFSVGPLSFGFTWRDL